MGRRRARPGRSVSIDLTPALDGTGEDFDEIDVLVPVGSPASSGPRAAGPSYRRSRPRPVTVLAAIGGVLVGAGTTWGMVLLTSDEPLVSESSEVSHIRQVEAARLVDIVRAEDGIEPLAARLSDDFVLVDVTGDLTTKSRFLRSLLIGEMDFRTVEPIGELDVRLRGDSAVVQYEAAVELDLAGVGAYRHPVRTTVLYERQDGEWVAVRESTSSVGPLPNPVQD